LLALGLAAPAAAQQQGPGSFIGSFNGQRPINRTIDTSKLIAPIQPPRRPFSLVDVFPRFSAIPGVPTPRGGNRMPSPSEFPGVRFQSPIQPLPPIYIRH